MSDSSSGVHIHRGRLSKACQRCRDRRLRCDLQRPSCSSCVRSSTACKGYRETKTIRIHNQSEYVRYKVLNRTKTMHEGQQLGAPSGFTHLPQDLLVIGRSMFFSYYVADFSRTWDFLKAYQDPQAAPDHLGLSIDAVSLAFLSHRVCSIKARELGRRKYGAALKKLNEALPDPAIAGRPSTFQTTLVLDLFEKITTSSTDSYAHVKAALALVRIRGVEQFQKEAELAALIGLACNATIYALSTGSPIPESVREIRKHVAQFVDTSCPKWELSNAILEITDLEADRLFFRPEFCAKSLELDKKLEEISLKGGPLWRYERKFISGHDPRRIVPDGFFPLYDVYPDRTITQMWNVLRVIRIQLCEQIVEGSSRVSENAARIAERAKLTITSMIREILASVPQMTNCEFAARHKLPKDSLPTQHTHTISHILDVYILIHALYIVAWSRNCPQTAREWTLKQLEHISEHFCIREASIVLTILREQGNEGDCHKPWPDESRVIRMESQPCNKGIADPWTIYRLLGSYAFATT